MGFHFGESYRPWQSAYRFDIDDQQLGIVLFRVGICATQSFGYADRGFLIAGMIDENLLAFFDVFNIF